jgi:hypothetical protein
MGKFVYIAFSRHDCVEYGESGRAGYIADHMMQLEIHLVQRLLHVLHVVARQFDQAVPVPQQRAHRAHLRGWAKRCPQQPDGVQVLQPLAI